MRWSREKIRFVAIRTVGNFFLLFSIYGMVMTFGPALYQESRYRVNQLRGVRYVVAANLPKITPPNPAPTGPDSIGAGASPTPQSPAPNGAGNDEPAGASNRTFFGELTGGNRIETISPVSSQFGLVIPKIGANAPIYPNVDAGKPEVYLNSLKQGVAHALGTVFPGVPGNIFLFAHSTDTFWNVSRYNAIFFLLKELEPGDEVDVFYLGVRHVYRVTEKKIVDPTEVHYLTDPLNFEQLTLQTCWPPGTTLKRMLVFARPERDLK